MNEVGTPRFRHLFVVSGPSGSGKGSVMAALQGLPRLEKITTFTTRARRPGEVEGHAYNYVTQERFDELIERSLIFEKVQVYGDYFYGSPTLRHAPTAPDRFLELDPEGLRRYQQAYPGQVTGIFLLPPSLAELRERIQRRSPEKNIDARLQAAIDQLQHASDYNYLVRNDALADAQRLVRGIVTTVQQELDRASLLDFAAELVRTHTSVSHKPNERC